MSIILPPGYLYFDGLKYTTNSTIATAPLSGDVSGNINSNTVIKINGATVPYGGFLTIGNVLQASGLTTLSYAPLNLAGGSNYIAGILPLLNYAIKKTITAATPTISVGKALISNGNNVTLANSTYLLNNNFIGIALTGGSAGQEIQIITNGVIDTSIINLGAGFACAVGVNASGALVRVTDTVCVSGLTYIGRCNTAGTVFIAPSKKKCFYAIDYGFVADWNGATGTDNLAALQAALDAMNRILPGTSKGGVLHISGYGYVGATLHVLQSVLIKGDGRSYPNTGSVWAPGTMLVWPKNVTALRFHGGADYNEAGWTNPGTGVSSYRSILQNITIYCSDATTTSGHGIHMSTTIRVEDCHIEGFGGHGIAVLASYNINGGNASGWRVRDTEIRGCKGHGLYVAGFDANVGVADSVNCNTNGGYGFFDDTTLGNTYVGCHGSVNHSATYPALAVPYIDYKCTGAGNSSLYSGCYAENGGCEIDSPAVVEGGILAGQLSASSTALCGNGGGSYRAPIVHDSSAGVQRVRAILGSNDGTMRAIGWHTPDSGDDSMFMTFDVGSRWWGLELDANPALRFISFPTSQSASKRMYAARFQNGILIGQDYDFVAIDKGTSAPSSGVWVKGDRRINTDTTELGSGGSKYLLVGWCCAVGGDFAGTPPTFLQMRTLTGN